MHKVQISMYLPPEHPIIFMWNNKIPNGHSMSKKIYSLRYKSIKNQSSGLKDVRAKIFYSRDFF